MNTADFIFNTDEYHIDEAHYTWRTPSNIALVKYWGKSDPQLPKNASISFTLNNCHTTTSIRFSKTAAKEEAQFELFFEGEKKEDFKPKIAKFFKRIQEYCPYVLQYDMHIESSNSFPHSSGIASSASGMSAIAMCLMNLEQALNPEISADYLKQKASFLARLGSGSASRSIEGPLVVWGTHETVAGSSDLFGVRLPNAVHPVFEDYQDCILLVDKGEKQVSSTVGHNLMFNHPFAERRFEQANDNLAELLQVLASGDLEKFISIVESEALTLHAMMLTSEPYFILMKPNTLEIIQRIWEFRKTTGSHVCFTLDAGANVHVLYPKSEKQQVESFINTELLKFCQKNQYICDNTGLGAQTI